MKIEIELTHISGNDTKIDIDRKNLLLSLIEIFKEQDCVVDIAKITGNEPQICPVCGSNDFFVDLVYMQDNLGEGWEGLD